MNLHIMFVLFLVGSSEIIGADHGDIKTAEADEKREIQWTLYDLLPDADKILPLLDKTWKESFRRSDKKRVTRLFKISMVSNPREIDPSKLTALHYIGSHGPRLFTRHCSNNAPHKTTLLSWSPYTISPESDRRFTNKPWATLVEPTVRALKENDFTIIDRAINRDTHQLKARAHVLAVITQQDKTHTIFMHPGFQKLIDSVSAAQRSYLLDHHAQPVDLKNSHREQHIVLHDSLPSDIQERLNQEISEYEAVQSGYRWLEAEKKRKHEERLKNRGLVQAIWEDCTIQ